MQAGHARTPAEFRARYARRNAIAFGEVEQLPVRACSCGGPGCEGWEIDYWAARGPKGLAKCSKT